MGCSMNRLIYCLVVVALAHTEAAVDSSTSAHRDSGFIAGGLERWDASGGTLVWRRSGEPLSPAEGARVLRSAAERGGRIAQADLGFAYMRGVGVPHDDVQARYWSQKAAEAGVPTAHVNLAYLYLTGRGGPKSYLLAYKHYFIAAFTGAPEENFFRGQWYENERAARNVPLTVIFYLTAARQHHVGAAVALTKYMVPLLVPVVLIAALLLRAGLHPMTGGERDGVVSCRLSSRWTPCFKFVVSALWFCMLVAGALLVWLGVLDDFVVRDKLFAHGRWIATASGMAISLFFGTHCVLLKRVALDGRRFHVSNYLRRVAVPIQRLTRVSGSHAMWLDFITLEFADDTGFGRRIVFMPTLRLVPLFTPHPTLVLLRELMKTTTSKDCGTEIPGSPNSGEAGPHRQVHPIAGKLGSR